MATGTKQAGAHGPSVPIRGSPDGRARRGPAIACGACAGSSVLALAVGRRHAGVARRRRRPAPRRTSARCPVADPGRTAVDDRGRRHRRETRPSPTSRSASRPGSSLDRVDAKAGLDGDADGIDACATGAGRSRRTPASTSRSASPRRPRGRSASRSSSARGRQGRRPHRLPIRPAPSDRVLDQFVYAGVKPPTPDEHVVGALGHDDRGHRAGGVGVIMFAVLRIRWRAAPRDRR